MVIADKFNNFFYSKEERDAAQKVHMQELRAQYMSAAEDTVKSAKRTCEAYKEMKTSAGSDAQLAKLVASVEKSLIVPF